MIGTDPSPTRSALLELQDERQVVREGFEFLDEKRVILAQEMLRRLADWQLGAARYAELQAQARIALARALGRHGLDGLELYPAQDLDPARLELQQTSFLGISLIDGALRLRGRPGPAAVNPSPEARHCGECFLELSALALDLAVRRACLERLLVEYARTERRARALENVVLPEIDEALVFILEQLEAVDQEEAIRVRMAAD